MATFRFPVLVNPSPTEFAELLRLGRQISGATAAGSGGAGSGTSGGGSGGGAATLEGYTAAQLLGRASHTGPWYAVKYFPDQMAGVVWRGRYRGGMYRLAMFADGGTPMHALESRGAARAGDWLLATAQAGVVFVAAPSGGVYRAYLDDTEADAPMLALESVATLAAARGDDLVFGDAGVGLVLRDRVLDKRWLMRLADDQGAAMLILEDW